MNDRHDSLRLDDLPADPCRPVRLGVIGLGWSATSLHFPSLEALQRRGWAVEIAALCDRDEARVRVAAARFPQAAAFSDAAQLLAHRSLDGVLILTRPDTSAQLLRQAIRPGLPILVEKPVAATAVDAAACAELARQKQACVQVGYNRRHQPLYASFRRQVSALPMPRHFKVRFWRCRRAEPEFFHDTLVHPLDLLLDLMGPLRVKAATMWPARVNGVPDYAWHIDLTAETEPRVTAEIDIRPSAGSAMETYEAVSREHACALEYPCATGGPSTALLERFYAGFAAVQARFLIKSAEAAAFCYGGGFVRQLAEFVRACAGESPGLHCTLEQASTVLQKFEEIVALRSDAGERAVGKCVPLRFDDQTVKH